MGTGEIDGVYLYAYSSVDDIPSFATTTKYKVDLFCWTLFLQFKEQSFGKPELKPSSLELSYGIVFRRYSNCFWLKYKGFRESISKVRVGTPCEHSLQCCIAPLGE